MYNSIENGQLNGARINQNGMNAAEQIGSYDSDNHSVLTTSVPDQSLFATKLEAENQEEELKSSLNDFFKMDYYSAGYREGNRFVSSKALEQAIQIIKGRFLKAVDQKILSLNERILKIEGVAVDIGLDTEPSYKKLKLTITYNEKSIEILEKQKMESRENQGWVMVAVNSYRSGFLLGRNDRLMISGLYKGESFFN